MIVEELRILKEYLLTVLTTLPDLLTMATVWVTAAIFHKGYVQLMVE